MSSMGAILPGSLPNAGDLALVSQLPEADTANAEIAQVSVGSAADLAAVVVTGGELAAALLLQDHRFLSHTLPPYLENGAPSRVSSSRASSSVVAVVVNTMSMPRILSILS